MTFFRKNRRLQLNAPSSFMSPKRAKRWFLWLVFGMFLAGLGTFGWLSYRATAALSRISDAPSDRQQGGLLGLPFLNNKPDNQLLKGEADDRVNILILGVGGAGHKGGQLADTIMVLSLHTKDNKVALLSIPRDLYVPIPDFGSGKINNAHAFGEQQEKGNGPALAKKTVENVLGIPLHYYVRVDFGGFTKLVDAVGGVDVNVEKALADPFYPDERTEGYAPFYLKAGQTHMDGKIALKYARSRETTSDFDRARRQQQLLAALKDKLLSVGTLTNPQKMTELIEIAGDHVRTDLAVWEMQRLASYVQKISPEAITNKVLDTSAGSPLTSRTDARAGYIIVPRRGNFGDLEDIARNIFGDVPAARPTISILNASGDASAGGNVALVIREHGYQVGDVGDTKKLKTRSQIVTKAAGDFTDATSFLKEQLTITSVTTDTTQTADILLVIGQDYTN